MELDISQLHEIEGFLGGCVVDVVNGSTLSSISFSDTLDMDRAGVVNSDVVRATQREVDCLVADDQIEDILISLGDQYHLIRPIGCDQSKFVFVAVRRSDANLALARTMVRAVEKSLKVA